MPGQKLWLWALSRSGGIWEDLLTDTDGQYIEFQAGRLLNQYSAGSHLNPIRQVGFAPHATDRWKEVWFPFKNINGMVNASPYGVINVTEDGDMFSIGINALQHLNDTLIVKLGSSMIHKELLRMSPMDVFSKQIEKSSTGEIEIAVGNNKLNYSSREDSLLIKRPFEYSDQLVLSERQRMVNEGVDAMNFRAYDKALSIFNQLLEKDPSDREALLSLSDLYFRRGEYDKSIHFSSLALMQNTYDAKANFLAGISYQKESDPVNALESFGWAARSVEYRSAAYTHMAEMYTRLGRYEKAVEYTQKALDFNKYNITARSVQIIANRLAGEGTENLVEKMLDIDPLNHLARYEKYISDKDETSKANFTKSIANEFPEETYLELALFYRSLGLENEAKEILEISPSCVKNDLWLAYILRSTDPDNSADLLRKCIEASPAFVFPYRLESLEMLEWAVKMQSSWKLDYYLALIFSGLGRTDEAADLFKAQGDNPDYWVFYLARTILVDGQTPDQQHSDLERAMDLAPESWRTWEALIQFYLNSEHPQLAVEWSKKATREFPDNYTLGFLYAKALLNTDNYQDCINVLNGIQILPFEGATESRRIYEEAHIRLAINVIQKKRYKTAAKILVDALKWPENIGVGKPYDPEQRKAEILLAYCYDKLGQEPRAKEHLTNIIDYTMATLHQSRPDHYLGLTALKMNGEEQKAEEILSRINDQPGFDDEVKQWINHQYKGTGDYDTSEAIDFKNYNLLKDIGNIIEQ
jgi:tetratricopeptide (TPR) repeat protein